MNDFERMLIYEFANQIVKDSSYKLINKKILSYILDNKTLFEDDYFEKIKSILNIELENNTVKYVNNLINNPTNENLRSIITCADSIDEIFSVLRQAENILSEEIRIDIYVEAICKCYDKAKTNKHENSKINIALFCEELIAEKPIVFTEVINILREMYKDRVYTNKTIETLRYIRHTVKDEKIIDDILLKIKYENSEFDNEFIEKISIIEKNATEKDFSYIDRMLNKLIYDCNGEFKYNDIILNLTYNFYKRNNDLNALSKLCKWSFKNNLNFLKNNIKDVDIVKLIDFYEKNNITLNIEYKLGLINEYKYNNEILKYGETIVELIFLNKDERGIELLNNKYHVLLKLLKKNSDIIYEQYLKLLEFKNKKTLILDLDEVDDIKNILNRKNVPPKTKLYMLRMILNYYIAKFNEEEIIKYLNVYIYKYEKLDKGELFKNILYNHSNNIEFIELILNKLDFNSIGNAELFLENISIKLTHTGRTDLLPLILRYYIANKKYVESVEILKRYISKSIQMDKIIKNICVYIDEINYYVIVDEIMNNISEKSKLEVYKLLINRDDLPIDIREKYFYLYPTLDNTNKIIESFVSNETKTISAKKFALEKFFDDDKEFLRLSKIGDFDNDILEIIYKKVKDKFKSDKDYVKDLIENNYKLDNKLSKIYDYTNMYHDNFFIRMSRMIFGEYICTHRSEGDFVQSVQLTNVFNGDNLDAICFVDEEYRVDNCILKYFKKLNVNYEKIDLDIILINEEDNLTFLENGEVLLFLEKVKALIKLQKDLILNERMIISFNKELFILNEKGFIPVLFKGIFKYGNEFKIRNSNLIDNSLPRNKYITLNEKNICINMRNYIKEILIDLNINTNVSEIKDKFIENVLDNDSIIKYDFFLESIDKFIEDEKRKFEYFTFKEKLKKFYELNEYEKESIVSEILAKEDTTLIAKKIVINYYNENIDINEFTSYLIDCFNNFNDGLCEDDYISIYGKVNENLKKVKNDFYQNKKNEILNFYINANIQLKLHGSNLKQDIESLDLPQSDKNYLFDKL